MQRRATLIGMVLAWPLAAGGAEMTPLPAYVGTETCTACHEAEAEAWRGSHHDLAWTLPGPDSVLGDFDDAVFEHKGVTTRFSRDGDRYIVETEGPDGAPTRYEVAGVAGIAPLQQYLVETEPGRLQALDVAWDAEAGRWYHLYPDDDLPPGDGLHWTGPYKTWNARCAECHATGYVKAYDTATRRYASHQAEIGVGCEACHGPGEAHVAWAEGDDPDRWPGLPETGLVPEFAEAEAEIQQCVGCHSRREAFLDGNPLPGTPFHDAYRLSLLEEGLYHPDGSIRDEVYVYGSFLQSKMYAKGVRCSDCHDPHALDLKAEGNAVCTQCHSPAGNPRFPTLKLAEYDSPSHHFHQPGSEGASCRNCHMIDRVYMGIDWRRDHSFRVPRPDLGATGAPDACTDCHEGRDAAWAAEEIAARFPDGRQGTPHFAEVFAAARTDLAARAAALADIASHGDLPGIVRATALELLAAAAEPELADAGAEHLSDPDPLVRAAAVPVQRAAPPDLRAERLAPLLSDPARSVRMAAAREFLSIPRDGLSPQTLAAVGAALGEWQASLAAKADFPETHMALGGAALTMRDVASAEAAFRKVVRQDPQMTDAWGMIARILAATGDAEGAAAALDDGLAANPGDPYLGMLRGELR